MRLIDADALTDNRWMLAMFYDRNKLVKTKKISEVPTVDAVPVVRCEDCTHHEDEEPGMVYCPAVIGGWVSNDFFCCDGERREG